jgi:hypothetical protein
MRSICTSILQGFLDHYFTPGLSFGQSYIHTSTALSQKTVFWVLIRERKEVLEAGCMWLWLTCALTHLLFFTGIF